MAPEFWKSAKNTAKRLLKRGGTAESSEQDGQRGAVPDFQSPMASAGGYGGYAPWPGSQAVAMGETAPWPTYPVGPAGASAPWPGSRHPVTKQDAPWPTDPVAPPGASAPWPRAGSAAHTEVTRPQYPVGPEGASSPWEKGVVELPGQPFDPLTTSAQFSLQSIDHLRYPGLDATILPFRRSSERARKAPGPSEASSTSDISISRLNLEPTTPFYGLSAAQVDSSPVQEINYNRRYDHLPRQFVPFWYEKQPPDASFGDSRYLCATCRHINFRVLFAQEESDVMPQAREYIVLGTLESLTGRQSCGFCRLAAQIIRLNGQSGGSWSVREAVQSGESALDHQEMYYLCPTRPPTEDGHPMLHIYSGSDLATTSAALSQARPDMSMTFRQVRKNGANKGRILSQPETIDFNWVRETLDKCDDRDYGKLDYKHEYEVRVIDVEDMCIVNLPPGTRYLTLSYTWGKVEQLLLERRHEAVFRKIGGLDEFRHRIPRTIRDCITLTRRIGERYLWVDALCIFQDDPEDLKRSIEQMGGIYCHSILTVCACCGEDAEYGLPGVEPGTRKTTQVVERVGSMVMCNVLPDADLVDTSKWNTRAWTMQEKVLSQRKLQITDQVARYWCWHTTTAEDQNCQHSKWRPATRHERKFFYNSEHKMALSRIPRNCNMDTYAFMVSDYTSRDLSYQGDASSAITGVFRNMTELMGSAFVFQMPEANLGAALLWSPVGSLRRRVDASTGAALFPSWSWLGWAGHVSYPWLLERTMPMSEAGSPFQWRDVSEARAWFTGEEYRLDVSSAMRKALSKSLQPPWRLDEEDPWVFRYGMDDRRWLNPVSMPFYRPPKFLWGSSWRLEIKTLSAMFSLEQQVRRRKENHNHENKVHQVRVLNSDGFAAGYIYVPDPDSWTEDDERLYLATDEFTEREFIVLSRSSTNSDPREGRELVEDVPLEELPSIYSMSYLHGGAVRMSGGGEEAIDSVAHFDTRLYDSTMPWGLFNVMMIEREGEVAHRVTVGRIHVAAFMEAAPAENIVYLE